MTGTMVNARQGPYIIKIGSSVELQISYRTLQKLRIGFIRPITLPSLNSIDISPVPALPTHIQQPTHLVNSRFNLN